MKTIINFFKTILYGIIPAISGGVIVLNIYYVVKNFHRITTGSGWDAVLYFILGSVEIFLTVALLYELGSLNMLAGKWQKHLKNNSNVDNETENETSDMAAEDIGEPDSNTSTTKKRSKKK